jgi:hypothetical protein
VRSEDRNLDRFFSEASLILDVEPGGVLEFDRK